MANTTELIQNLAVDLNNIQYELLDECVVPEAVDNSSQYDDPISGTDGLTGKLLMTFLYAENPLDIKYHFYLLKYDFILFKVIYTPKEVSTNYKYGVIIDASNLDIIQKYVLGIDYELYKLTVINDVIHYQRVDLT